MRPSWDELEDLAGQGCWAWDTEKRTMWWSRGLYCLLGLDPDTTEPGFDTYLAHLLCDDQERAKSAFGRLERGGEPFDGVDRIVRADGAVRWLRSRGRAEKGKGGKIVRIFGLLQEVTDYKRVEDELRAARNHLRAVYDASPDMIWLHGEDGRVIDVNRRTEELTGYAREELRRLPPETCMGGGLTFEDAVPKIQRALRGERVAFDWVARARDGREFPVDMRLQHFERPEGAPEEGVRIIAVGRDVTERRKLEEQLAHSQRMESLGRLAGGVAHDFNNLLSVILTFSDLLSMSDEVGAGAKERIAEIRRSGERAAELTRRLLEFSRRQTSTSHAVNLDETVERMRNMLARTLGDDVEVEVRCDGAPWWVRLDAGQLEQMLLNLAVNSRDAMPRGGVLRLRTTRAHVDHEQVEPHPDAEPGEYVRLTVEDTGTGMDRDTVAHIFEPFFTTKEKGRGTGLGLSLVHGLVTRTGGFIEVDSRPGQGSRFDIYLPRARSAVREPEDELRRPVERGVAEGTVLVVEDEPSVRRTVTAILESSGFKVIEASSGKEAIELTQSRPQNIDLLLADVVMPRMGGREVAEHFAAHHPDVPVLYMSGHPDDAVFLRELLGRGVPFIAKPFTAQTLVAKVEEVLGKW